MARAPEYLTRSCRQLLFEDGAAGVLQENQDGWTDVRVEWADPSNQAAARPRHSSAPWRYYGTQSASGPLLGGCLDSLEGLKGTPWWPPLEMWTGAVFFFETSEERPSPMIVKRWLRNYAAAGILERLSGMLVGRPQGAAELELARAYDEAILAVVRDEQGLDFPIVTQMDFGHTDPMLTLPYGVRCSIDPMHRTVSLDETAVG